MEDMKNVKLIATSDENSFVIDCYEMLFDLNHMSIRTTLECIEGLPITDIYTLEYHTEDNIIICNNARIIKYQFDFDNQNSAFVKFFHNDPMKKNNKFKLLKDTVENLLNNSDSRIISVNLDRRAGHTSTALWLMQKNPKAILIVKNERAKHYAIDLADQLGYEVDKNNIIIMYDGVYLPELFVSRKFDMVLIDDLSIYSKETIEKIIYHTSFSSHSDPTNIRYVCLG